jgi:muramoyltetrapeptide carboxypeptidase
MLIPPYLKKGDTVAIVATARKISREDVLPAKELLELWGLNVVLGNNLFAEYHQFAGTDTQRLDDFQKAINAPEVKAVLCARGGYGTNRIIDNIDFSQFTKQPKWIAGYSDVTVLHNHIQSALGIATIHSTMPINFPKDLLANEATETLRKALFGIDYQVHSNNHPLNRQGIAEGILTGGNLSIIYSLTGTSSQIVTKGKILILEDLDEYLYHVDRMMANLKRSGLLHGLKGLIVGGMTQMKDNATAFGKSAEEIILESVKEFDFPISFGFPVGHWEQNQALVFGQLARLEVNEKAGILNYLKMPANI